ncbi:hypothetical protein Pcinc_038999 [Petrolisthes cinctipes]|uniref:Uncharacterized protein n=1 Tax=Petrolisthes cinctipes TaxID=88211 RepID=A0AAE1BPH9_PETCI|nr:hypothetical protein Pcinc_038999 [Petrolisthes cinctipes]
MAAAVMDVVVTAKKPDTGNNNHLTPSTPQHHKSVHNPVTQRHQRLYTATTCPTLTAGLWRWVAVCIRSSSSRVGNPTSPVHPSLPLLSPSR